MGPYAREPVLPWSQFPLDLSMPSPWRQAPRLRGASVPAHVAPDEGIELFVPGAIEIAQLLKCLFVRRRHFDRVPVQNSMVLGHHRGEAEELVDFAHHRPNVLEEILGA